MTELSTDSGISLAGSAALAREIHSAWDQVWPTIAESIGDRGLEIRCGAGCHGCCFDLKACSESEGLLIDEYLRENFPADRQEHFRSRVESAAACFRKRRKLGVCESSDEFERSGGIECPFLEQGRCAIYPVRPLSCRSMVFATPKDAKDATESIDTGLCRKCPASVACLEAQVKQLELQARIDDQEASVRENASALNVSIAERLSEFWESETVAPTTHLMTSESWETRLARRETPFDQTWRDDGYDWQVIRFPVVLPDEGEYPPDIVVLRTKPETHEVYGQHLRTNALDELRVLYKLLPGGSFDWEQRTFETKRDTESHIVWMGWIPSRSG